VHEVVLEMLFVDYLEYSPNRNVLVCAEFINLCIVCGIAYKMLNRYFNCLIPRTTGNVLIPGVLMIFLDIFCIVLFC